VKLCSGHVKQVYGSKNTKMDIQIKIYNNQTYHKTHMMVQPATGSCNQERKANEALERKVEGKN
jgi:hypothetical protein